MFKKLSQVNLFKVEFLAGIKMMIFMMIWKCNIALNVKNFLLQMTLTSAIYLVKNIKMHKKHLMKLKIMKKLKNKQNKSLFNNNKKGKR